MPAIIYIKNEKILEQEPEKILKEKAPDYTYLSTLNYDCTPPKNPDGSERSFDNKKHDLASSKYKELQIQRKKNKELIKEIQSFLGGIGKEKDKNGCRTV